MGVCIDIGIGVMGLNRDWNWNRSRPGLPDRTSSGGHFYGNWGSEWSDQLASLFE